MALKESFNGEARFIMIKRLRKHTYAAATALLVVMFALSPSARAQAPGMARIILEAHNVWGDGSGYQMLFDADHNLYGGVIPTSGPIWDNNNPPTDLFKDFEYKIPAKADPSTTPQYMVIDGEDYIEIPAGIYDFCIVAPQANQKIWIAGDADGPTRGDDCEFEAGKTYRFTMHIVQSANNDGARLTITENGEPAKFKLWVGDAQVTAENYKSVPITDGTAQYDPLSKRLFLENAIISPTGEGEGLKSMIDGLSIYAEGVNVVTTTAAVALQNEAPHITIAGEGNLILSGQRFGFCTAPGSAAAFKGCVIDCGGSFGSDNNGAEISLDHATIKAKGKDKATMCGIKQLKLDGCSIVRPEGADFDASLGGVALNGALVTDSVVIEAEAVIDYGLAISGVKLTSANYKEIYEFPGVSGNVNFDPENKVLTLQDVVINAEDYNGILSSVDDLTIKLLGANSVTSKYTTISLAAPTTITGGGTLYVKSDRDCALYANGTNLAIDNCKVNAESSTYAIAGSDGTRETLTINNATVTAEGKENGSICDFANVVLTGCELLQPAGAAFDSELHGIALNGAIVKSKVIIGNSTGIQMPVINAGTKRGVYTLSGVRLKTDVKDLPKGIYVVNGKKMVKK